MELIELFGGIGACTKALKNIGMNVDVVDYVEIDKYAVKSYNAINGTNFEPQDIKEWDKDINVDIIMHGSPCQDFSVAGKQAGGNLGSGTRSSLLYETIRIVGKLRPKYVIWENVKNLLSKKHKHNFDNYIETMNILGYNSYYQVLNAKDYGIPQNRERVYTISIRKDIDNGKFIFPEKEPLKIMLQDLLEKNVDEKYYLTENMINYLENGKYQSAKVSNKIKITKTGICSTLDTIQGGNRQPMIEVIGNYSPSGHEASRIVNSNGLAPTVKENHGTVAAIKKIDIPQIVKVRKYPIDTEKLKQVLRNAKVDNDISNEQLKTILDIPITTIEHWFRKDNCFSIPSPNVWFKLKEILKINTDEFDKSIMTFEQREGIYEKANRCYLEDGLAPTLTTQEEKIITNYRIRKLTPLECWRLMSFDDKDFYKAQSTGNSNSQLYKQARKLNSCKCS